MFEIGDNTSMVKRITNFIISNVLISSLLGFLMLLIPFVIVAITIK